MAWCELTVNELTLTGRRFTLDLAAAVAHAACGIPDKIESWVTAVVVAVLIFNCILFWSDTSVGKDTLRPSTGFH